MENKGIGSGRTGQLRERLRVLERAPLFDELPDHVLRGISRQLRTWSLTEGESAASEDQVLIVADGTVERTFTDAAGKVLGVQRARAGEVLPLPAPELAARVTVHAITASRIYAIDRDGLLGSLGPDGRDLVSALEKLARDQMSSLGQSIGRRDDTATAFVLGVYSPKGGSGRTTLAVNTAMALARDFPREVLLFDASLPYCHVSLMTDLVSRGSLASLVGTGDAFSSSLMGAVLQHPAGLMVLPAVVRPEDADLITADLVTRTMAALAPLFRVIVVDLGVTLNEATLAVLDMCDRVALVVPPELTAIKDVRRVLDIFAAVIDLEPERVDLVMNQRSARSPLDRDAVERLLGRRIAISVGHDGSKPEEAAVAGQVQAVTEPDSAVARGAAELAQLVRARVGGKTTSPA